MGKINRDTLKFAVNWRQLAGHFLVGIYQGMQRFQDQHSRAETERPRTTPSHPEAAAIAAGKTDR